MVSGNGGRRGCSSGNEGRDWGCRGNEVEGDCVNGTRRDYDSGDYWVGGLWQLLLGGGGVEAFMKVWGSEW